MEWELWWKKLDTAVGIGPEILYVLNSTKNNFINHNALNFKKCNINNDERSLSLSLKQQFKT